MAKRSNTPTVATVATVAIVAPVATVATVVTRCVHCNHIIKSGTIGHTCQKNATLYGKYAPVVTIVPQGYVLVSSIYNIIRQNIGTNGVLNGVNYANKYHNLQGGDGGTKPALNPLAAYVYVGKSKYQQSLTLAQVKSILGL